MAEIQTVTLDGWYHGLNTEASEDRLAPDELAVAQNVEFGPRGEIRLRQGFNTRDIDTETYEWIWGWKPPAATYGHLVVVTSGPNGLLRWFAQGYDLDDEVEPAGDDSMDATIGGYDFVMNAVVMNDLAYISRSGEVSHVYQLTPTPASEVGAEITVWDGVGSVTTEYPAAVATCVAYERVFAANINVPGTGFSMPERLFFSDALLPKSWDGSTQYIDISPDQNQQITAMRYFNGQIVIFKDHSIWAIAGSDFTSIDGIEVYNVSNTYGTKSPYSVVDTGSLLLFLDPVEGVIAYDGSGFTVLSTTIWEDMKAPISDSTSTWTANGWFHNQRYHLSFPDAMGFGSANEKTWVYDFRVQAWSYYTYAPRMTSYLYDDDNSATWLVGCGDAQDGMWVFGPDPGGDVWADGPEDPTFGSSNYQLLAETGWFAPTSPGRLHRLRGVEVDYGPHGGEDPGAVYVYLDDNATEAAAITPSALEVNNVSTIRSSKAGDQRFRRVKFKIEYWAINEGGGVTNVGPFEVTGLRFHVSALPRIKGSIT